MGNSVRARITLSLLIVAASSCLFAQHITVDITPSHAVNMISPVRALGAGIDRDPLQSAKTLFDPAHVQTMLTAGWGGVSYRLNTELAIQAWHWNPAGTWSDAGGQQGYFVGASNSPGAIQRSFGYNLPHRGVTSNDGSSGGYSRLDDGNLNTYWKSNPYLSEHFSGMDSPHPQWVLIDLGGTKGVDAISIAWTDPYAVSYRVQYWTGGDAIYDPAHGRWQDFPGGTVTSGTGGTATLRLSKSPIPVHFVRVWMTVSSNTCDSHGPSDIRNCVGYAIREVYLGHIDAQNKFIDLIQHEKDGGQTATYCSSVDPWHTPSAIAKDDGEQPGFDLVYGSGITRGLPMTVPVAMLYDNPDNAAAEIAYLDSHNYAIKYVELGEEPDGQFIQPEDEAALYIQWADAIHAVAPNVQLAGPIFEGVTDDIPVWPDAQGNTSWFTRFLNYLRAHGHINDLNVMTYEHYPFSPCNIQWSSLYQEPQLVSHIVKVWQKDGLPAGVPQEITEYNLAFDQSSRYMEIYAALWHADFVGSFLTAGGNAAYYYQYEPLPMYQGCGGWGTFGMFNVDNSYSIKQNVAQFFSSQLLTQEWAEPVDAMHTVFPAASDIQDADGNVLVTAYALQRPDGQWSVLLVNKDPHNERPVTVRFHDAGSGAHYFENAVTQLSFGNEEYSWHPDGAHGFAEPDGPASKSNDPGGAGVQYLLPKASITVLRGTIQ
ncbi:MAG TPA: discoidin domain-containing protein [Terriglobales bacterium]|nr:discoidin domain-containing protein [Terriglobales bacterium]